VDVFLSCCLLRNRFSFILYSFTHNCPENPSGSLVFSYEKTKTVFILQAPPNLHPFVMEGLVRMKTFFAVLLGVAYSVSKSESSSSSEVRNYDHHRWETNKQMKETNTHCVPLDGLLFYHWVRCKKVGHRGLKECVANRFSPRPYFAGLFRALQAPCGVAIHS